MIDQLAAALEAAKIAEADATTKRIDAENALIALLGCKDEGSATHRGGTYKVTITGNVNRRVDPAALDAVRSAMPAALFDQVFRYKPEIITAGVRYLQNNEPQAYALAAQAITASPGKPSVRLEAIEAAAKAA